MNNAARSAFKDISKYLAETYPDYNNVWDRWYVSPNMLDTSENRRLNAILGIRNVNFYNNKNRLKKKK